MIHIVKNRIGFFGKLFRRKIKVLEIDDEGPGKSNATIKKYTKEQFKKLHEKVKTHSDATISASSKLSNAWNKNLCQHNIET